MKSTKKKAQSIAEQNLTRPKTQVASNFSFWPVTPMKAKY